MTPNPDRKIVAPPQLAALRAAHTHAGRSIVLCHGCFDIVHPGHLRYLQFARGQGDVLVVSLTGDDAIEKSDGTRPYVPQELRAENLAAIEFVDHVVIAPGATAEPIITALRPDVYVKGKEYEHSTHAGFLAERTLVERTGGRVIFSCGQVVFSSTNILQSIGGALPADGLSDTARLRACCHRWQLTAGAVRRQLAAAAGKRIAVVGDALCDRYVFCESLDVAGEAPILSVRPLQQRDYPGAAAIVASHLAAMGAEVHLITAVADDEPSRQLLAGLDAMGVRHTTFAAHKALPIKQRYLVQTQKLLKIDQARAQPLDRATQREVVGALTERRDELDAAVFADFGLGMVTEPLLAEALAALREHVPLIAGDVSGPRRTLLAMCGFDLLSPNERELRRVTGDFEESLPAVAMRVMKQLRVRQMAVTMAARGCVLFSPREDEPGHWFTARLRSEFLPSLATRTDDPVGAGDAMLAAMVIAQLGGATLAQAGYTGSLAAALAIARLGNVPVTADELVQLALVRPELQPGVAAASA